MDRYELAQKVAANTGLTEKQALDAVISTFSEIADAIVAGDQVNIREFGKFGTINRKAYVGKDPFGNVVEIPQTRKFSFKISVVLRRRIIGK